ncbi:hypothetical protein XdyCFBP7245_06780 [Xanthomonas dyei]|uniref:Uncharacterized protein n=1 Tax=Xanthomonas dyei TaxID=743699 RepID=A0A2S7C7F1_9XANT|nr:hypothetical protein XdyCFBP7245_06780 [Xanthomonas dyei]
MRSWQTQSEPISARHALLATTHTDQLDWSLPAHRRVTFGGMDAAKELTRTYLQRVPRGWAGKGLQPSCRASGIAASAQ